MFGAETGQSFQPKIFEFLGREIAKEGPVISDAKDSADFKNGIDFVVAKERF